MCVCIFEYTSKSVRKGKKRDGWFKEGSARQIYERIKINDIIDSWSGRGTCLHVPLVRNGTKK